MNVVAPTKGEIRIHIPANGRAPVGNQGDLSRSGGKPVQNKVWSLIDDLPSGQMVATLPVAEVAAVRTTTPLTGPRARGTWQAETSLSHVSSWQMMRAPNQRPQPSNMEAHGLGMMRVS